MHGQVLYLLSRNWYDAWTAFARMKGPDPGPIDNWHIVFNSANYPQRDKYHYGRCRFKLSDNIMEGNDFICLLPAGWESLRYWYGGGPPLPRIVLNDEAVNTSATVSAALCLWPAFPISVSEALTGDVHALQTDNIASDSSVKPTTKSTAAALTTPISSVKSLLGGVKTRNIGVPRVIPRVMVYNDCGICSLPLVCFGCHAPCNVRCGKCLSVNYCSKECQLVSLFSQETANYLQPMFHV